MTVNAHTHLYSGLVPFGMPLPDPEPRTFLEILERVWWPLDRALDAPSLRAAARFYIGQALATGTTALIDHHESPNFIEGSLDVIADACQELGMPALICYGATERNGGRREAERGLEECRRFIRSNRRPLVRGAVGLHAAFTCSDDTLREAGELCRELRVPLHVHVAEDGIDRDGFKRLVANDAIVPGSILAHGVHLTRDEVQMADRLECWFVHNPRSNRANGVGYASALRASSHVALGTDGFPSDMEAEAAALMETREVVVARVGARIFNSFAPARPHRSLATLGMTREEAAEQAAKVWERIRHDRLRSRSQYQQASGERHCVADVRAARRSVADPGGDPK